MFALLIAMATVCMLFAVAFAGQARAGNGGQTFTVNDDTTGPGPTGATCETPDFNSIQTAIDDDGTTDGDTILVCAGTYNEGFISINKALTVTGAGTGQSIIDGGDAVVSRSANLSGQVNLNAPGDIEFSGFTIQNPSRRTATSAKFGIYAGSPSSAPSSTPTYTVTNNEIIGEGSEGNDNGYYADTSADNLIFTDNVVSNVALRGVGLEQHAGSVEIARNNLEVLVGSGVVVFPTRIDLTEPYQISNNTMNVGGSGVLVFSGDSFDPGESAKVSDITIENNEIEGSSGVTLRNTGTDTSGASGDISNAQVTGNTLTGTEADDGAGVRAEGLVSNPDISGNSITGFDQGISARPASAGHEPTGITANQNRIFNNSIGLENISSSAVNAENNWWGCNEGPNQDGCDTTENTGSGSIDADPHIVMGIRSSPPRVATGGNAEIIVRFLLNSGQGQPAVARDFPDGPVVEFSGRRAQINPKQVAITNGSATTTLTTNSKKKAAVVFADFDAERVKERVKIRRR